MLLPVPDLDDRHFAIRASGTSMEGITDPAIHDGDWLVMRWARSASRGELRNRVALVSRGEPGDDRTFHLNRLVQRGGAWLLVSDNPELEPMPAEATDDAIARLERVVRPGELAPEPGSTVGEDELAEVFGVSAPPEAPWSRADGHLFILLEGRETLAGFATVALVPGLTARPGETAFVLGAVEAGGASDGVGRGAWRYLGVARQEVDRTWGSPNSPTASRRPCSAPSRREADLKP